MFHQVQKTQSKLSEAIHDGAHSRKYRFRARCVVGEVHVLATTSGDKFRCRIPHIWLAGAPVLGTQDETLAFQEMLDRNEWLGVPLASIVDNEQLPVVFVAWQHVERAVKPVPARA